MKKSLLAAVALGFVTTLPAKTVVFPDGVTSLDKTLEYAVDASGLVLKAEHPGKAVLSGAVKVGGWTEEKGGLWSAPSPKDADGKPLDFVMLVRNGKPVKRAVYPGHGKFLTHDGKWDLPLLPAMLGWWARQATLEERTVVPYRPEELPAGLDLDNADARFYYMWDESMSSVASNNVAKREFYLKTPASSPFGAFDRYTYELENVREGLDEPGRWYLDRKAGRVWYRPVDATEMSTNVFFAPRLKTLVKITGDAKKKLENVRIEGLVFEGTDAEPRCAGFGGDQPAAAVEVRNVKGFAMSGCTVRNVGGVGLSANGLEDSLLEGTTFDCIGARGFSMNGTRNKAVGNVVRHVGLVFYSSCAVGFCGNGNEFRGNAMDDIPYSGMIVMGDDVLIEGNRITRAMTTLHDGAAVYAFGARIRLRRNAVRDIVAVGAGFGASAYYFDEGSLDCSVEECVAVGVPRPVHNHISRHIMVKDCVFETKGDMTISFERSIGCEFTGNRLFFDGELHWTDPDAVATTEGSVAYLPDGVVPVPIPRDPQPPRAPLAARPVKGEAPKVDGRITSGEYMTDEWERVDRTADGHIIGSCPTMVVRCKDDKWMYVAVHVSCTRFETLNRTEEWGVGDGVRLTLGKRVLVAYATGKVTCDDDAYLARCAVYAGPKDGKATARNYVYEFRLPLEADEPFNVESYNGFYRETRRLFPESGARPAGE